MIAAQPPQRIPKGRSVMVADCTLSAEGQERRCRDQATPPDMRHQHFQIFSSPDRKSVHDTHAFATTFAWRSFETTAHFAQRMEPATVAIPVWHWASRAGNFQDTCTRRVINTVVLLADALEEVDGISDSSRAPTLEAMAGLVHLIVLAMDAPGLRLLTRRM